MSEHTPEAKADARILALKALVELGGTFSDCAQFFYDRMPDSEKVYSEFAQREMGKDNGELEIDSNAVVSSGGEAGAYVMAWTWVSDNDLSPEEKKRAGVTGEDDA